MADECRWLPDAYSIGMNETAPPAIGQTVSASNFAALQNQSMPAPANTPPAIGQTVPANVFKMMQTAQPTYNPSSVGNTTDDVVQGIGKGIGNFASQAYQALKQSAAKSFQNLQGDITPLAQGLSGQTDQAVTPHNVEIAASAAGHATVGTVSDLAQLVLSPITATIGTAINNTADAASDIPAVQGVATSKPVSGGLDVINNAKQAIDDWATAHPSAYKQLSDIVNVAGLAVGGKAAPEDVANTGADLSAAKEGVSNVIDNTTQSIKDNLTPPPPPDAGTVAAQKQATAGAKADTQWMQYAKEHPASTAAKILTKSPEVADFLGSNQGLNPAAHIEDGFYTTLDTADTLEHTAGEMSSRALRPSLQAADYYTPKASVSSIVDDAVQDMKKDTSLTPKAKIKVEDNIRSEGEALSAENPNGMDLTASHDNKITYARNGKYNPIGTPSANRIATANRYLSSALGKDVETRAPAELNVGKFNEQLSHYYKAADYLRALNGKKAPVTLVKQIARGAAKFGGAMIARHLIGGDLISDFAGYQIGKFLERHLENMTEPMRGQFLENIRKTASPDELQKIQSFLDNHKAGNPSIPKLMPANSGTPIPMGAIPTEPVPTVLSAKKGLPTQNPKTGRMQKVYTSEGVTPKK